MYKDPNVGDTVQEIIGSPDMKVTGFTPYRIAVEWYDSNKQLQTAAYRPNELKLITKGAGCRYA